MLGIRVYTKAKKADLLARINETSAIANLIQSSWLQPFRYCTCT